MGPAPTGAAAAAGAAGAVAAAGAGTQAEAGAGALPSLPPVRVRAPASRPPAAERGSKACEPPVSPTGRAFLHPLLGIPIVAALQLRGTLGLEDLRACLAQSLAKHPRFCSRVVFRESLGQPWARWVPVELRMEEHVREVVLPPEDLGLDLGPDLDRDLPGPGLSGLGTGLPSPGGSAVERHMARVISRREFDFSRPLWEAHLLHVPRPGSEASSSTVVFVLHHALGDGTSLMSLLLSTCRQAAHPHLLPTIPGQAKHRQTRQTSKEREGTTPSRAGPGPGAATASSSTGSSSSSSGSESTGSSGSPGVPGPSGSAAALPSPPPASTASSSLGPPPPEEGEGRTPDSFSQGPEREPQGQPGSHRSSHSTTAAAAGEAGAGDQAGAAGSLEQREQEGSVQGAPGGARGSQGEPGGQRERQKAARGAGRGGLRAAVTVAGNSALNIAAFTAAFLALSDSRTPLKASSRGHHREKSVAVSEPMDLGHIQDIRKAAPGATVNDVLVSVMALALERYLSQHQQQGPYFGRPGRRPRITATGLVNLRQSPGVQELSVMLEESKGGQFNRGPAPWGNKLGMVLLPLPVALHRPQGPARNQPPAGQQAPHSSTNNDNTVSTYNSTNSSTKGSSSSNGGGVGRPVEVLRRVKGVCDRKKHSVEAQFTYLSGRAAMALGGTLAAAALVHRVLSQTTLSLSNVVGPAEEVTWAGVPVAGIYPTAPPVQQALCCHFQSYNGQVRAVLAASLENYPDLPTLSALVVEAFRGLHEEALGLPC